MKIKIANGAGNEPIMADYANISEACKCARMSDALDPDVVLGTLTAERIIERADAYDPRGRGAALDGLYALLSAEEQSRYKKIATAAVNKLAAPLGIYRY